MREQPKPQPPPLHLSILFFLRMEIINAAKVHNTKTASTPSVQISFQLASLSNFFLAIYWECWHVLVC